MTIPSPEIPEQIAYLGTLLLERLRTDPSLSFRFPQDLPASWSPELFKQRQQALLLSLGQRMARFSPKAKDLFDLMFLQQFAILSAHLEKLTDHIRDLHRSLPRRAKGTLPPELLACRTLAIQYLSETLDALLTGPEDRHEQLRNQLMAHHNAWKLQLQTHGLSTELQPRSATERLAWGRLLGVWEQILVVLQQMNTPLGKGFAPQPPPDPMHTTAPHPDR